MKRENTKQNTGTQRNRNKKPNKTSTKKNVLSHKKRIRNNYISVKLLENKNMIVEI